MGGGGDEGLIGERSEEEGFRGSFSEVNFLVCFP